MSKIEKIKFLRVYLSVDSSNFDLSLRSENRKFQADWDSLGQVFPEEAGKVTNTEVPVSCENLPDRKGVQKEYNLEGGDA